MNLVSYRNISILDNSGFVTSLAMSGCLCNEPDGLRQDLVE
jgi:hypothetical protein